MADDMGERRQDPERAKLERLLEEAAARGAMKALEQFTPHDLTTKDGRERLRSDFEFARAGRERCEKARGYGMKAVITVAFTIGLVAFWDHLKEVFGGMLRGGQ